MLNGAINDQWLESHNSHHIPHPAGMNLSENIYERLITKRCNFEVLIAVFRSLIYLCFFFGGGDVNQIICDP